MSERTLPSDFLGIDLLLIAHHAIFWDVGCDFFRFRQRTDPLVVVELLRGRVFFFPQKHQLCGKSPVTNLIACERDDGIQMFLPFTCCLGALMGVSLTCGSDAIAVFAAALFPHCTPRNFVPSTTPSNTRRFGTFRTGGIRSGARAPRDQGCGPVLSTVGRALPGSTHESFHGFADGSPGVKSQARFQRCSSVCGSISRFLLRSGPECCCPNIVEMSTLTCPASHIRNPSFNSEWTSGTVGAQQSPRLVAADGSFERQCSARTIGEARRSSANSRLSRSVRKMSRKRAVRKRAVVEGSPGGTGCGVWWAGLRALYPGAQVGAYHFRRRCIDDLDLMVSQAIQAARSRLRSCATLSGSNRCAPCF